jgi:hypothetical protein
LTVGTADHAQPEQPVRGRATLTPLENAPDEPTDDQGRRHQEHTQGQGPDAPAEARCGVLSDHKESVMTGGARHPRALDLQEEASRALQEGRISREKPD